MSDEMGTRILGFLDVLSVQMSQGHAELRSEIGGIDTEIGGIHAQIGGLRGQLAGVRTEINGLRQDMLSSFDGVHRRLVSLEKQANGAQ